MTLKPGFQFAEAQLLLEIAQQAYAGTPSLTEAVATCGVPAVPQPNANWAIVENLTPTSSTLLDNYWQVWQNQSNTSQYAIAVRGTVASAASVLADLLFPLINARFDLKLGPISLPFYLARDEGDSAVKAGVHSGFALSLLLMLFTTDHPLFVTLGQLAKPGNDVYITGHSQGASIATLLTSLVRHSTLLFKGPAYKTYTFAPAKAGNDHYAYDYARLAGFDGYGWAVTSTQDWVPQAPFTLQWISDLNTPNPLRGFGGSPNPEAMPALGGLATAAESAVSLARDELAQRLQQRVEGLSARLTSEPIHLNAAELGAAAAAPITGSAIADLIRQILDQIQDSLDYAAAGSLLPLFATPGANPTDGTPGCQALDYFWQHHLGNYLKYMTQQYGG
ncbi:lipase family protein [Bradyrhizobium sp.]|uniref:lipase family protein n=1 Tax=Bradyrhizobium sp. TaxID=376 RepID=UPI003C47FC09